MRNLSQAEMTSQSISGGNAWSGLAIGGLLNAVAWGSWTILVDHKDVTLEKGFLVFCLGAAATLAGIMAI